MTTQDEQTRTVCLLDYPGYIVYSDGRIQNAKSGYFLKQDGPVDNRGYRKVAFSGRTLRVHKLIALAFLGEPSRPGQQVDHLNRNPLDNRAANLRWASRTENAQNRSPNKKGSSAYQGVTLNKATGKYRAHIFANGKAYYLGQFNSEVEAAVTYQIAKAIRHRVPMPSSPLITAREIDVAQMLLRQSRVF